MTWNENVWATHEALQPYLNLGMAGRNDFEGERTQSVYSLVGRGQPFEKSAEHPVVLAMLDRLLQSGYLLIVSPSSRRKGRRFRVGCRRNAGGFAGALCGNALTSRRSESFVRHATGVQPSVLRAVGPTTGEFPLVRFREDAEGWIH